MTESSPAPLQMLNTSFTEKTPLTGGGSQVTFSSPSLLHEVTRLSWLIVPPVLLVLGCFGNVMIIVVMRAYRPSKSTSCLSVYFIALAVSDLFVVWINLMWNWPERALHTPLFYFHEMSCTIPFFGAYMSSMTSAWLLVALTCQRMLSIVLPHRVDLLCTARTGKFITAAIITVSCAASVHIFVHYRVEYVQGGYPACASRDKHAANVFGLVYLCSTSVIPFLLLVGANSVLIYGVMQSVKMAGKRAGRGDSRTSPRPMSSINITLILTSTAFLLLTLPSCVLWVHFEIIGYYEGQVDDAAVRERLASVDSVCLLLWMSNSVVNFYIYVLSGRKLRQEATRYLCLCFQEKQGHRFGASP